VSRHVSTVFAAIFCLLLVVAGAGARPVDVPGVSPTEILLGGTAPLTGPESAYSVVAEGANAYFQYADDHGGVFGRKIRYLYLDDAYDPAQTVQQTRQLVEQDKVFAIFNTVGTQHALAIRPYLNQLGVPELFAGSGASALTRDAKQYPWTIGYLPSFLGEGKVYGGYIATHRPKSRIAVLYEDSDFGHDMLTGLQEGLHGKARIVAKQSYAVTDADVTSQISALRASKADTLMLFALPKQVIQAFLAADKLGWRPHVFVAAVSIDPFVMAVARENTHNRTTEGAISIAFLKDPTNAARWGKDPGVKLYYSIMKRYDHAGDPNAVANFYGMAVAYTMVDTLKHAGKNPTRESVMNAATHLKEATNPFLLPGIVVKTGPGDRRPLDQVQMYRYHAGVWRVFGPIVRASG
jgi:ABC-type branched-subunit amino acid transport system substrate-binding protein